MAEIRRCFMLVAVHWVKFDRDGNITIKAKIVPGSEETDQEQNHI